METARPASTKSLAKTFSKVLRSRRATEDDDAAGTRALKSSKTLGRFPTIVLSDAARENADEQKQKLKLKQREEMETLVANLFVGISAIKAAYAQLQVAQTPYNPDAIQSADEAVVFHLKYLSQLKHAHLKKQPPDPQPALSAQIQEQRNLLKTYQITTKKLESELKDKDAEIGSLKDLLFDSEKQCFALDAKLHPNRSLSGLHDLHLSGLNPTHFLSALRYAVKSVRTFVKQLVRQTESAGWDVDAAAGAIQRDVLRRGPTHSSFAFNSFVCLKMFSDFQRRDFGLHGLEDRRAWDRRRFFEEFSSSVYLSWDQLFRRNAAASAFARSNYLSLVHPKMEAAFFGNLDLRATVSSGRGFPGMAFFAGFAEMARRVWLLHCLFCSFGAEEASIFQVARGARFSEVYMESVAEEEDGGDAAAAIGARASVAFTVVPGFRVGRTVIQCRVYLSSPRRTGGRS